MGPLKTRLHHFEKQHPILFALGFAGLVFLPFIIIPLGLIVFHGNTHYPYPFLYPTEQIASIQLMEIREGVALYSHSVEEIPAMLAGDSIVLEESKFSSFLEDFVVVPCHRWVNDPCPQIVDGTILITYTDGSMEWICADGTFYSDHTTGKFSMTWFYFDDDCFLQLLRSYGLY